MEPGVGQEMLALLVFAQCSRILRPEGRILICGALDLLLNSLRFGPVAACGGPQSERRDRHAAKQIGYDVFFHGVCH